MVNQNCNSSELVLIIFTPDDSLLALGDHVLVQQLKETHSSLWLPRLPPCVKDVLELEAKRKNIEEVLRHCHVLEHDFKYMNTLCRTLVISLNEMSYSGGKRELLNATGLGIPTF